MRAIFRTIAIVGAQHGDGMIVGIAQVRKWADAQQTRMVNDGAVALVVTDASGRRVDVLLTPEEAMQVGPQICAAAAVSASALPPSLTVGGDDRPPRVIQ